MAAGRSKEPLQIVVTGAGRGLGLEFTRQWLRRGDSVAALVRAPEDSAGLKALGRDFPKTLLVAACDVARDDSVTSAHRAIGESWDRVDILVNNAGIYGRRDVSLMTLDEPDIYRVFEVNTLGPLRVCRAFLPLLQKGRVPRLVQITSLMGSIDDNGSGGSWAYRISKTALNMASRNVAHEVGPKGMIAVLLHPGWVRTDMGGELAPLAVEEAIRDLIGTVDGLKKSHNGGFFDRHGKPMPW